MLADGDRPLTSGIAHVTVRDEGAGGEEITAFVLREHQYPEMPVGSRRGDRRGGGRRE